MKERKFGRVMEPELLHYEKIVEEALRSVVRTALEQVMAFGLPEGHSLYITFLTTGPGVDVPQRLIDIYPEEMTIVLEHQFWNLQVEKGRFFVELSFSGRQEQLEVPFATVTSFADPSVPFGLKFELTKTASEDESIGSSLADSVLDAGNTAPAASNEDKSIDPDAKNKKSGEATQMGEVVNLDYFRKKR
ncbi:MAG: ClpXP protease specificity-enhancing factor SspB [Rhodospirillaceae bacterium]|nr:ClpXP protease specificity-enhancing factor SspB [Rhodospirillaceae bacterium]MCY4238945.1 ClpXP protease specificity-enhancing factor SspB [Rhodospirillaceae bacterium]MCY4311522.1 ClpXP protease specificity-enhancing factor SspB [Rhodospirillaceae bacterium]